MKFKYSRNVLSIIAATAVVSVVSFTALAAALNFYLPVSAGMSGGSFSKLMDKLVLKLGEATDNEVSYEEDAYALGINVNDMMYDKLKSGKADITYLNSMNYVDEKEKWDKVFVPAFTLIMNNTYYNEFCMYAPKDSALDSVESARGKVWGGMNTIPTRLLLHDNGVDEPLADFFSDTKFVNESPVANLIDAQAAGDIEIFTAVKSQMIMSAGGSNVPGTGADKDKKQGITFKEIACTQGDHGWVFGFRKGVSEENIVNISKVITKVHKDPNFSEFQFMFMAVKGRFERFDPKRLARTEEIVKLKNKLGWDKEAEEHYKKAGK